jgi:hypothetical protein
MTSLVAGFGDLRRKGSVEHVLDFSEEDDGLLNLLPLHVDADMGRIGARLSSDTYFVGYCSYISCLKILVVLDNESVMSYAGL